MSERERERERETKRALLQLELCQVTTVFHLCLHEGKNAPHNQPFEENCLKYTINKTKLLENLPTIRARYR